MSTLYQKIFDEYPWNLHPCNLIAPVFCISPIHSSTFATTFDSSNSWTLAGNLVIVPVIAMSGDLDSAHIGGGGIIRPALLYSYSTDESVKDETNL